MKQKEVIKKENLYVEECSICKKEGIKTEIMGYSEAQVNSRMEMHMRTHKSKLLLLKKDYSIIKPKQSNEVKK